MSNENPKQQLIDEYIQNAYQLLNQRVNIWFTFDEATSTSKTNIALLVKDEKRSFTNNVMNASDFENSLIIGENYDALKNLIQIEKIRAMTGGG